MMRHRCALTSRLIRLTLAALARAVVGPWAWFVSMALSVWTVKASVLAGGRPESVYLSRW